MIHNLELDQAVAWASGQDEANRFMKKAGKKGQPWAMEAYNVAVREWSRIMDALYPQGDK